MIRRYLAAARFAVAVVAVTTAAPFLAAALALRVAWRFMTRPWPQEPYRDWTAEFWAIAYAEDARDFCHDGIERADWERFCVALKSIVRELKENGRQAS
jgi:hypothetical protein